jgi:hypothetical protein
MAKTAMDTAIRFVKYSCEPHSLFHSFPISVYFRFMRYISLSDRLHRRLSGDWIEITLCRMDWFTLFVGLVGSDGIGETPSHY